MQKLYSLLYKMQFEKRNEGEKCTLMGAKENAHTGYVYILPSLLIVLFIFFFPLFTIFQYSFSYTEIGKTSYLSTRNYQLLFTDSVFWRSASNNLRLMAYIPVVTFLSLLFSVLLYERVKGWRIYRSVIVIPYILSITIVGIIFSELYQYNGCINTVLEKIGLGFLTRDWLGSPRLVIYSIGAVIVWKQLGFGIIIFLARLMSIDEQLLEAAKIDGASWGQILVHIMIPQLATIILFFVVMSFIWLISWVFTYVYVMTSGGPAGSSYVMELYIYRDAFRHYFFGKASAASVTLLVFAIIGIAIQFHVGRKLRLKHYG